MDILKTEMKIIKDGVIKKMYTETSADMVKFSDTTVADVLNNFSAGTAETADLATSAEKDSEGNIIFSTYAPLDSPNFTGTPTAPTSNDLDLLTNQVATVAWCNNVYRRLTGIVPENMDTLQKFYSALGEDSDLATTLATELSKKQDKSDLLTALSNQTFSADKILLATGANTFTTTDFSAATREILCRDSAKGIRRALHLYREKFFDECENRWVKYRSPDISPSNAKFNNALQLNGQNYIYDYKTFGGADFSFDFWGFMASSTMAWGVLFGSNTDNTAKNQISIGRYNNTDTLSLSINDASGNSFIGTNNYQISEINPIGTLRHYEFDYSHTSQTVYFFVDGNLIRTFTGVNLESLKRAYALGVVTVNSTGYCNTGAISEFRFSDCVRHTENFTPPTEKYELDEHTISLLHFD